MAGPVKMKGWSPFTQKTHPKHPVTPPSKKEKETSKGTLKGVTGFEQDIVIPTKDAILTKLERLKKNLVDPVKKTGKKMIKTDKQRIKKVKDYFTKR